MEQAEDKQGILRRSRGRIVSYPHFKAATENDFVEAPITLFIHGFTAHARYLDDWMHQFAGAGFRTLAYEYPSDSGIKQAAAQLRGLLEMFDAGTGFSRDRLVLVCHSMGGLVGRAFLALEGGSKYVRKLITVGTPHAGTLDNATSLKFLLQWGEHLSELNPRAFAPKCVSALELMGKDPAPPLLTRLVQHVPSGPFLTEYCSVSGGLPVLEVGRSALKNKLANVYLQGKLSKPNDGLVEEVSSDLSGPNFAACAPSCVHINTYEDYEHTNHSHLINNQLVALKLIQLARQSPGEASLSSRMSVPESFPPLIRTVEHRERVEHQIQQPLNEDPGVAAAPD